MKTVIIGRPGTGKTTTLLNIITEELDPRKTMFIAFSRKAIFEARMRAMEKYGLESSEIKYFRTLHSICFKLKGWKLDDCLKTSEIKEFFEKKHIRFIENIKFEEALESGVSFIAQDIEELPDGNIILGIMDWIRHVYCKKISRMEKDELKRILAKFFSERRPRFRNLLLRNLDYLADLIFEYEAFKGEKIDYTDTLILFLEDPVFDDEVENLVVDEFQDLTPLMYKVVKFFESKTKNQFYAGDELQTIYSYMGSSPEFLIREYKSAEIKETLRKSWRLPKDVCRIAEKMVEKYISKRIDIEIEPREEIGGIIKVESISPSLLKKLENEDVYFLHRTNAMKKVWKEKLISMGIRFKEMGIGKRIWTRTLDSIYSALLKIKRGEALSFTETLSLIEKIPSKPFLIRGVKAKLKRGEYRDFETGKLKESFTPEELKRMFFSKDYGPEYILEHPEALKIEKIQLKALKNKLVMNPTPISDNCLIIGTIHSAKGGEADYVILNCKLTRRLLKEIVSSPKRREEEARVFYVGVTRTRGTLFLLNSSINPLFRFVITTQ